jgi:hypothetical protein
MSTLKNGFFGLQNSVVPLGRREKNLSVDFEYYDLAKVRNEFIRFSGHVDIEVRYKILRLEVLYNVLILHNSTCFQ